MAVGREACKHAEEATAGQFTYTQVWVRSCAALVGQVEKAGKSTVAAEVLKYRVGVQFTLCESECLESVPPRRFGRTFILKFALVLGYWCFWRYKIVYAVAS